MCCLWDIRLQRENRDGKSMEEIQEASLSWLDPGFSCFDKLLLARALTHQWEDGNTEVERVREREKERSVELCPRSFPSVCAITLLPCFST